MRRRRVAALAAFVALVTGAAGIGCGSSSSTATAPPAIAPNPDGIAFGFNQSSDARSIQLQEETGVPLRRFKVPWNDVEPAPGHWSWGSYDAQYRALLAGRLRPLLLAIGAPCWTRPGRPCSAGPPDADFDGAWGEYVRRLAARYPEAVGVEIWNEPNIVPMFPPYPDPQRYTSLLQAAYDAVKTVNPRLPVITGGLFATDRSGPYGIADSRFLAQMYAAGAGDSINAIGAHPYPMTARDAGAPRLYDLRAMEQALDRLRAVRDETGNPRTPIWITEAGVSTASAPGYPLAASTAQQAHLLSAMARAAEGAPDVQVMVIHKLIDASDAAATTQLGAIESGFGVFDSSGLPKPAACALSRIFRGTLSCQG
jgi:polysaccharide biosynthesis protein PslG